MKIHKKNNFLNAMKATAILGLSVAMAQANSVEKIEKLDVFIPEELTRVAGGFPAGIGSSLEFVSQKSDGSLEFLAMTDRGPNYPAFEHNSCMVSFKPDFTPIIAKVVVSPDRSSAEVKDFFSMNYLGKPVTGVYQNKDAGGEVMCSRDLVPLPQQFGLDPESVSIMRNGTFVVGDEYVPSLNFVDPSSGTIMKRLTPGNGLPEILKYRPKNRGFEAVTVAPDGTIWGMLESVLEGSDKTKNDGVFIRLVHVDPESGKTEMFAYPFDYPAYKDSSKVKIGDMTALDNQTFLVVEQGPSKTGKYRNKIYKIRTHSATDLSEHDRDDEKHLEHGTFSDLSKINFVKKELVFDPRQYGWTADKLEGLAVIDQRTIAIMNDNDFGLDGITLNKVPCPNSSEKSSDSEGKNCLQASPVIEPSMMATHLWIVILKEKL